MANSNDNARRPILWSTTHGADLVLFWRTSLNVELLDIEAWIVAYALAKHPDDTADSDAGLYREMLTEQMRGTVKNAAKAGSLVLRDTDDHNLDAVPARAQFAPFVRVFVRAADLERLAVDEWNVRTEPEAEATPEQYRANALELYEQIGSYTNVGRRLAGC